MTEYDDSGYDKERDGMKKRIVTAMPFVAIPILIPIYSILDNLVFVEVFGCGCVPSAQTNMLNIPFNANDLKLVVFTLVTIGLSAWSVFISKGFNKKTAKIIYCFSSVLLNVLLTMWVVKTFMWA